MSRVRLPALPFGGYEPPATQPTAPERVAQQLEQDKNLEAYTVTLPVPADVASFDAGELVVYKTFAPWRALDVYVQVRTPAVYAIVGGARTLVASGRYEAGGNVGAQTWKWMAAARSQAQRFEVTIQYCQPTIITQSTSLVDVAIVASNEATDVPDDVGTELANVVYMNAVLTVANIAALTTQVPHRLELVSVRAVNGAAAPRFLQLHDLATLNPGAGAVPLMVWPLGNAIGLGLAEMRVRYRAKNRPILVTSTTMNTFTAAADCSISAQLR
jgi:hypothetical protein